MTPTPKPPKRMPSDEIIKMPTGHPHQYAMNCLEDAIYYEPDDAIVEELVRVWRKMGRKK